ncbi:fluoride efflux transporter CrcB [Pacificimonas sp. WHA3]|uniref:Fluoride-specific ion channel FluC n=1 Tax=Pacificimonas pallii TaxID=2827236 RepID=A0ABS6SE15_9SPHN|nr:fluoride efflux transporter CrcB [Pacificimonas pallii]MBV7256156.1 fluoride efflux transporter CrcB [Pacificimonas pallii]
MLPVPLSHLGLVALGGAVGAGGRFLAVHWVSELFARGRLPWGTFAVNVIGSFLIGVVIMATIDHAGMSRTRLLLVTGILGGFTTFSAFSFEMSEMLIDKRYGAALGYSMGSVVISVLATLAGALLTREFMR